MILLEGGGLGLGFVIYFVLISILLLGIVLLYNINGSSLIINGLV